MASPDTSGACIELPGPILRRLGAGDLMWTLPRHGIKFIITALVTLALGSAFIFNRAEPEFCDIFTEVRVSETREHVRELLGEPDGLERSHVPEGIFWGPTEGLSSILGPGVPYEQWQWTDETYTYNVWFASKNQEPPEKWLVVSKGRYPTGAIF